MTEALFATVYTTSYMTFDPFFVLGCVGEADAGWHNGEVARVVQHGGVEWEDGGEDALHCGVSAGVWEDEHPHQHHQGVPQGTELGWGIIEGGFFWLIVIDEVLLW